MEILRHTRQTRLHELLRDFGGRQVELAERIGRSASQLNQWLSGFRSISEATARHIEERMQKPTGWLDDVAVEYRTTLDVAEPPPSYLPARPAWPFTTIDEAVICSLPAAERVALELAMLSHLNERGLRGKRAEHAKARTTLSR